MFKNFTLGLIISCISIVGFSQTVYEDFQDGNIHFKLRDDIRVETFTEDRQVFLDKYPILEQIISKYSVRSLTRPYFGYTHSIDRVFLFEFLDYENVDNIIRDLKELDIVEYAEKLPIYRPTYTPNDYSNSANYLNLINAKGAWDLTKGDENVIIAVIDNAIQGQHSELASQLWVNTGEVAGNGIDDDGNGYVDDINGWDFADWDADPSPPAGASAQLWSHGTHVAGIATGGTDNGQYGAALGFKTKLMIFKGAEDTDAAASITKPYGAVIYAARHGARVINMSFGTAQTDATAQMFISEAANRGVVMIAAAGNNGTQVKFYPAAYNEVIAVASTNINDSKRSDSNFGDWVDISSPGTGIYGPVNYAPGSTSQNGTSVASPIVAGLAGLIFSHHPGLSRDQVKSCILNNAVNIDGVNPGLTGKLGSGRIDALASLQCADALILTNDVGITLVTDPSGSSCSENYTPKVTLQNYGNETLTSVDIKYQVNGGTVETYNWTGSLAWLSSEEVTLSGFTMPTDGDHTFEVYTESPNGKSDQNATNDKKTVSFTKATLVTVYPYLNNFDTEIGGWAHESIELIPNGNPNPTPNDLWEWGVPQDSKLNGAHSGTKCWGTDLNADYDHSNRAYLYSPCFDLTNINEPWVEFWLKFDIEKDWDALFFDYSLNNGITWTKLGAQGLEWYNSSAVGNASTIGEHLDGAQWTGTISSWKRYRHNLAIVDGQASVKFRFHFISDDFTFQEGVLMDDFQIYDNKPGAIAGLEKEEVSLYPNPTTGKIKLNSGAGQDKLQVKVFDVLGNELEELNTTIQTGGSVEFDLHNYAVGTYYFQLNDGVSIVNKKVVLTR